MSMCVPWDLNPQPFCAANAMLYHWATGTQFWVENSKKLFCPQSQTANPAAHSYFLVLHPFDRFFELSMEMNLELENQFYYIKQQVSSGLWNFFLPPEERVTPHSPHSSITLWFLILQSPEVFISISLFLPLSLFHTITLSQMALKGWYIYIYIYIYIYVYSTCTLYIWINK